MEHLPKVTARNPPLKVPYYGGIYDDGEWRSFPSRAGWDLEKLYDNESVCGRSIDDLPCLIQTWLYIGVLCEVTGKSSEHITKLLGCNDSKPGYISTRCFRELFKELFDRKKNDPVSVNLQTLTVAAGFLSIFVQRHAMPKALLVSVAVLFEHLTLLGYGSGTSIDLVHKALKNDLLECGYCPSMLKAIGPQLGASGLYLLYLINVPQNKRRHVSCDDNSCIALRTDETLYIGTHAKSCPAANMLGISTDSDSPVCGYVGANLDDLYAILSAGTFPVVSIEWKDTKFRLVYKPYSRGVSYIAISHVMADGLGNFQENKVRQCRLKKLVSLLPGLYKEESSQARCFWLDTLCIPVKGSAYRKEALLLLKEAYEQAAATLILDEDLQNFEVKTDLDAGLSVITSAWVSRLWTLQEVSLSKMPWIAFPDSRVALNLLSNSIVMSHYIVDSGGTSEGACWTGSWCKMMLGLTVQLSSWIHGSASDRLEDSLSLRYSLLSVSLDGRETSDPRDEPLCLASMLDMDLAPLVQCRPEDRMKVFWMSQNEVPQSLLFIACPRFQEQGLRWAPKSLLALNRQGNAQMDIRPEMAQVTPDGVRCFAPGFIFASPGRKIDGPGLAFRSSDQAQYLVINPAESPGQLEDIDMHQIDTLAVLYPQGRNATTWTAFVALMEVTERKDDLICTRFLGNFVLCSDRSAITEQVAAACTDGERIETEWLIA